LQNGLQKQKITPWLTEHNDVTNIISLPALWGDIFC